MKRSALPLLLLATGCDPAAGVTPPPTAAHAEPAPAGGAQPLELAVRALPLPGATGPASLDYIAFEPAGSGPGRVWVPVGVTGSVDVLDIARDTLQRVDGWPTAAREVRGATRVVGPSSVAIGEAFAYVGNRAAPEVCAVDLRTLQRGACVAIPGGVDGVAFVRPTHEVWVTVPDKGSLDILDLASPGSPRVAATVSVGGQPEGYAVDERRGLFFTNLEDQSKTVAVDLKQRAVVSTWSNRCGKEGPRGVAVDAARSLVMVACTDHVEVLDAQQGGARVASIDTGAGVDNIDYAPSTHNLYVAAGKAARLTVVHVGAGGQLTVKATATTRDGARNAVVDGAGTAYVADSKGASLLVVAPGPGAGR